MRGVALTLFALMSGATAAGVIGTTRSFFASDFCQQYKCTLTTSQGNAWLYELRTGDSVLVSRESTKADSPVVAVSLWIRTFDPWMDFDTFAELQRAAVGSVANVSIENCYEAVNDVLDLGRVGAGAATRYLSCGRVRSGGASGDIDIVMLNITSVNAGRSTTSNAPATPASRASPNQAPKFTQWTVTSCTAQGRTTSTLTPGTPNTCQLVIDTVPNGARPINASFQYELEYRENGVLRKLTLPGGDKWTPSGGTVRFQQRGNQLAFSLPLNVRARTDRRYTSINIIGTVVFDNGSSKRVYEPLPIGTP